MTNAEIERRLEDQAHDSAEGQPPRPVTSSRPLRRSLPGRRGISRSYRCAVGADERDAVEVADQAVLGNGHVHADDAGPTPANTLLAVSLSGPRQLVLVPKVGTNARRWRAASDADESTRTRIVQSG